MKLNHSHISIAVLNASLAEDVGIASLAFAPNADKDGWCQLLPAGTFKAVDGRPHDVLGGQWFIDEKVANRLISTAAAAANDLVIDYEHQTLNADTNGHPAPAAGWFKEAEWREGSGLWIKPQWTERARNYIDNGEYRYLSAVFPYDKNKGEPLALHSAALVNRPGIDGLAATALRAKNNITSLNNPPKEDNPMNEALRQLLEKLGVKVAEGAELTAGQGTAALDTLKAIEEKANKVGPLEKSMATLKAATTETDLSKYVPAATYNALVTEMAVLKAGDEKNNAQALIKEAQASGKVLATEVDYLGDFAKQQGIAALKAMLDARPAIAALKSQQTDSTQKPDTNLAVLSADEHEAIRISGISEADYIVAKKAT